MSDTPASLALARLKEQIAALNYATDVLTVLVEEGKFDSIKAMTRFRRLSARRTDLRDERMSIISTGQVANPPTTAQLADLRTRVTDLYNWNTAASAIDSLIGEAIAIATA